MTCDTPANHSGGCNDTNDSDACRSGAHLARGHEVARGVVGDEVHRHLGPHELPRRELGTLETRPRLVDPHVDALAQTVALCTDGHGNDDDDDDDDEDDYDDDDGDHDDDDN